MKNNKFVIGIDFGTLSARAVLVDITNGKEIAESAKEYAHGVMDRSLPGGTPLGHDWALQHPADYLDCISCIIKDVLKKAGINSSNVISVGIDFTGSTLLPVKKDSTPLCLCKGFHDEPNAYVKMWKHHGPSKQAKRITELAAERNESFLSRYGGTVSAEWALPKILETLEEAPNVFDETDRFVEAGDWIVWRLTGRLSRSACFAGYKMLWSETDGYPSESFLSAVDPRLSSLIHDKFPEPVLPLHQRAGFITPEASALTGLAVGTTVAVSMLDAHSAILASGIAAENTLWMIMGTSSVHITLSKDIHNVDGIFGSIKDGIYPGFYALEAGQSCTGDMLSWYCLNCLPESTAREALERHLSVQALLTEKAAKLIPGESGLLALDWWNGNRSILNNAELTGVLFGLTLGTRPEDIYRALIESTAFGTKVIADNFINHGIPIKNYCACGGIAKKNKLAMQIYADVLGSDIQIIETEQASCLGAAISAASAAGMQNGGFDSVFEAAKVIGRCSGNIYTPIESNQRAYEKLFKEYLRMHDTLGRNTGSVLENLRRIQAETGKK